MTLRELAAAVRERRVGAHELVSESLRRIEALDGELNAVVALRTEEALDDARGLDQTIADGADAGPLAGLPLLVKDIIDVEGMRTTWGSVTMVNEAPAARDALVIARLRAAGAIVVGKTNVPEFAIEGFTSNLLFGTTRNPWNTERTPGGSSGGSAVAIAAGMAAIATATDGGGSIRIPASYCGLVGLKPTNGTIARDPSAERMDYTTDWIDCSTDGPFSTHVDDLRLLFDVMRGPGPGDPTALPSWAVAPEQAIHVGRVVEVERWSDLGPLPDETAKLFDRAVSRFAGLFGVDVERLDPTDVFGEGSIDDDWFRICGAEQAHRLGRAWIDEHIEELHPASQDFLAGGLAVSIEDYLAARVRRFGYTRALDDVLGDDGVALSPVMAVDAIHAEGPGRGTGSELYCTQGQNVTGHPAVSLPAGAYASGVPFGLQVTGPRFRDDLLLHVAEAWEDTEPWPRAAPDYRPFEV